MLQNREFVEDAFGWVEISSRAGKINDARIKNTVGDMKKNTKGGFSLPFVREVGMKRVRYLSSSGNSGVVIQKDGMSKTLPAILGGLRSRTID